MIRTRQGRIDLSGVMAMSMSSIIGWRWRWRCWEGSFHAAHSGISIWNVLVAPPTDHAHHKQKKENGREWGGLLGEKGEIGRGGAWGRDRGATGRLFAVHSPPTCHSMSSYHIPSFPIFSFLCVRFFHGHAWLGRVGLGIWFSLLQLVG